MAFDFLAIPTISSECERVFSSCSNQTTTQSSRLSSLLLWHQECLKNWQKRGAISIRRAFNAVLLDLWDCIYITCSTNQLLISWLVKSFSWVLLYKSFSSKYRSTNDWLTGLLTTLPTYTTAQITSPSMVATEVSWQEALTGSVAGTSSSPFRNSHTPKSPTQANTRAHSI